MKLLNKVILCTAAMISGSAYGMLSVVRPARPVVRALMVRPILRAPVRVVRAPRVQVRRALIPVIRRVRPGLRPVIVRRVVRPVRPVIRFAPVLPRYAVVRPVLRPYVLGAGRVGFRI